MGFYQFPKVNFYKFLIIAFIFVFVLRSFLVFAQLSPEQERALLEEELRKLEEKIAQYEKDITKTEQEKKTLQNQIGILKLKIRKLNLEIQKGNIMVQDLHFQIKDTESSIEKTSLKIEAAREKLATILRNIYEEDQKSLIEVLLSESTLSGFFDNLMALEVLYQRNYELLEDIKALKSNLESQKQSLDKEKEDLEKLVKIQLLQKQQREAESKERERVLKMTEAQYQQYLKEKQETERKAAQIRARIFKLIGVPKAPTFGEALEIAKYVERITGVRPAFLLAVLEQESAIGKNVGQCYLVNPQTGEGQRVNSGQILSRVMHPIRDAPHFLNITKELNRDPFKTLVSCPLSIGWGGAMGPAQFIPSTWMLYKGRLQTILGRPADPWNIKDAFLAAGLYLSDYGAGTKVQEAEWRSAMIYFSGSTNPAFSWYANNVLKIAEGFEKDIAIIEKNSLTFTKTKNNLD